MVRLCVVACRSNDANAGCPVTVRRTFEAIVILGCITDVADRVLLWIELSIQQPFEPLGSGHDEQYLVTNTTLDRRWQRQAEGLRIANELGTIVTGWETNHPRPTWIDRTTFHVVEGVDEESGHGLTLCQDDSLLSDHGLPAYSTSCHRYLFVPQLGEHSPLVPMTADAPTNEHTRSIDQVMRNRWSCLVPLNPAGGFMMAHRYSPISFEAFADVLAGQRQVDIPPGVEGIGLEGLIEPTLMSTSSDENQSGRLFLESRGSYGRLLESYHLKMKLLADAVNTVQTFVRSAERPLLNLRPASFGVRLGTVGCALPYLWTATLALVDGGDAASLSLCETDDAYFQRLSRDEVSIYQPRSASLPARGVGTVRLRAVEASTSDGLAVEGTIATDERIEPQPGDVVRLIIGISGQTINLRVRLDSDRGTSGG